MAHVTGDKAHIARLRRIRGAAMIHEVTQAVYAAAQDLAVDASNSITEGAVSGKNHVPSAPGEPPNAESGVLHNSIIATEKGPLKAEVSADAPYAAAQEFGSEKQNLPERPYLRPAAARERPKATKRVRAAVDRVLKASGGTGR